MFSVKKFILTLLITPLLFITLSGKTYSKEAAPQYIKNQFQEYIPKTEKRKINAIKTILEYNYDDILSNKICTSTVAYHYTYFCKPKEEDKQIYALNLLKKVSHKSEKSLSAINPNYKKYFQKQTTPIKDVFSLLKIQKGKEKEKTKNPIPLIDIFSKLKAEDKNRTFINNLLATIPVRSKEGKTLKPKIDFEGEQVIVEINNENSVTFTQAILPVRFVYVDEMGEIIRIWSNVKSTDTSYVLKFFKNELELEKNENLLFSYYKTMEETIPYQQGLIYDTSMVRNALEIVKSWDIQETQKEYEENQKEILSFT